MSIGISSASLYPLETENAVAWIAEHKVPCMEIFYNAASELREYFTDSLLNIMDKTGVRITALHPMLSFAEPYMTFSEYLRRFNESRENFRKYFLTATTLGASFINLHGDRPTGKLSVEDYCERFSILAADAAEYGVTLCQENVNGYRSADPEFLSDMVRLLGEQANFTLDIKQCVRAGYTVEQIMQAMQGKIRHVHISDHSSAGDCLLPLRGKFDFAALFAKLKSSGYTGDYMIEVYRNAYHDREELFDSYTQLCRATAKE